MSLRSMVFLPPSVQLAAELFGTGTDDASVVRSEPAAHQRNAERLERRTEEQLRQKQDVVGAAATGGVQVDVGLDGVGDVERVVDQVQQDEVVAVAAVDAGAE